MMDVVWRAAYGYTRSRDPFERWLLMDLADIFCVLAERAGMLPFSAYDHKGRWRACYVAPGEAVATTDTLASLPTYLSQEQAMYAFLTHPRTVPDSEPHDDPDALRALWSAEDVSGN